MKEYYEKLYAESEQYWGWLPSPVSLILLAHRKKGALLDLGCGQGPDAIFFARKGFEVTALDISPKAIEDLRRHAEGLPVRAVVADMGDPPHRPFDVVFSRMALQMVEPAQRRAYIGLLKQRYPDALHAHIVPISGACFGNAFICDDALLAEGYADWEILFSEECWTLSRVPNRNGEPYLMREARIIARRP